MRKLSKAIFAASIGIASVTAILIQCTPAAALSEISNGARDCRHKLAWKDKQCACKDKACTEGVHSPAAAKTGTAGSGAAKVGNGSGNLKKQ